jgi:hypothetical protein
VDGHRQRHVVVMDDFIGGLSPDEIEHVQRNVFPGAQLRLNPHQIQSLGDLVWEGKHNGTIHPSTKPPRSVALLPASGGLVEGITIPMFNRQREALPDPLDHRLQALEMAPPSHRLLVIAEDGRAWVIVPGGVVWPQFDVEAWNAANGDGS